jgi:hypothetical protein
MTDYMQKMIAVLLLCGAVFGEQPPAVSPSNPPAEIVTNSAEGEALMKHSFARDPWKLETLM